MTHPDATNRPTAAEIADVLRELTQTPTAPAENPPPPGLAAIGLRHHPRSTTRHRHPHRRWLPLPAAASHRQQALRAFPMRSAIAVAVAATFTAGVLSLVTDTTTTMTTRAAPPAAAAAAGVPPSAVPTPAASPSPPPTTAATPAPTAATPAPMTALSPPTGPILVPLTYTVVPGDNLSKIAWWFHTHGYGALYEANKAVLGDNPDLIHPGQHITITSNGMTMG